MRGIFLSSSFLIVILFATGIEAQATIRRVPTDYSTIQQAINASVNGDAVVVAPGTYVENINFLGKAITVTSEAGPEVTIIDGNHLGPTVRFNSGEGQDSVLSRLTVQRGDSAINELGGGISIEQSSPTITDNIITHNTACAGGAGIGVFIGSPVIQGNNISGNLEAGCLGPRGAGGIHILGDSSAQILRNTIANNAFQNGGGIRLSQIGNSPLTIRGNIITGNDGAPTGGGIAVEGFSPKLTIVQNVITRNSASWGAGIYIGDAAGEIINNTIADNFGSRGTGIFLASIIFLTKYHNNIVTNPNPGASAFYCSGPEVPFLEPAVFKDNDFFSGGFRPFDGQCRSQVGLNGNISADPLFVNPAAVDYHLRSGSPSIDTGDNSAPNLPATDLDGYLRIQDGNGDGIAIVDMGVYETLPPAPPFDICIQDDSSGSIFKFNSTTGDYQFTNCSGLTLSGTGTLIKRGSVITFQHYASDRRVLARIDTSVNKGTASIQLFSPSATFTITDRNTANNTCACAAH